MTNIINISEGNPRAASSIIPYGCSRRKVADFQKALKMKKIIDENGNAKRKYSKEDITFMTLVTFNKIELTQGNLDKFKEVMA